MPNVSIDNVTQNITVSSTTNSFTHVVGVSSGALIVTCGLNAVTVVSVTYNGVSLTKAINDGDNDMNTEIWRLVNPDTGSHTVVVTLNSGADRCVATAISLGNVNQVTPFGTSVSDHYASTSLSHSHNTTTQVGGMVVDVFTINAYATSVAVDAGQTSQSHDDNVAFSTVTSTKPATTTTESTGYTWGVHFSHWSHCTIPVNPSAAGNPWYAYAQQ